jgi:hypothetical protein
MLALGLTAALALSPSATATRMLMTAARDGNVATMRDLVLAHPNGGFDLEQAAGVAASFNRVECLAYLESVDGDTSFGEALLRASVHDRVGAVRWLLSPIRLNPPSKSNLQSAVRAAASSDSVFCEWMIFRELRRREDGLS